MAPSGLAQEGRLPGYYPTEEEVDLLGGESRELYGRHSGGTSIGGPDAGSLTASGLWRQDPEPTDSFYERHDRFFSGIDNTLGFLVPREVLLVESDDITRTRLYGYADPGFPLTRDFNPDLATMKLGPLYLDLIRLSGTVLYSDYDGLGTAGTDDGWLSSLDLLFRGGAQLTPNLSLTLSGGLYYLPGSGEVGFYFADGNTSFFRIAYEGHIGDWEYVLFNDFGVYHPLSDLLDEVEHDEIERAGRYRFGRFDDTRSSDLFDSDDLYFINRVGAAFTGPLGDQFRAAASFEHFDFWRSSNFDRHRSWDTLDTSIEYTGFEWPVIPYFQYQLTAVDQWDFLYHSVWLGARARLAENLRFDGRVGYFVTSGSSDDVERPIGELGLIHELTENTSHSLYAGVRQHMWEDGENQLATYARYSIAHRFGSRLRGTAFAQYTDLEDLDFGLGDREGWSAGGALTASLSDYTNCSIGVHYDEWEYGNIASADRERWVYRATLNQRLLPSLYARLLYQYEDYDAPGIAGFDEHLYMLTLSYLF